MAKGNPDNIAPNPVAILCRIHEGALSKVNDDVEALRKDFNEHRVEMAEKMGELDAKVSNGLTDRVASIDRRMWAFGGGILVIIGGMVAQVVIK